MRSGPRGKTEYVHCSFFKELVTVGLATILSISLPAQSQQRMGLDSFPVNDNDQISVYAALQGGSEINGLGKVCKLVRWSASTMYACSSSGGLYKSTDDGNSWQSLLGSFLPGVQMSCVAIDPASPNIMYSGTGEATYSYIYEWGGYGVFKSTDSGATWSVANTGMGEKVVSDILLDSTNVSHLVASCSDGLYTSDNSGATWTIRANSGSWMQQLVQRGNSDTLLAVSNDSLFISYDWGNTWLVRGLDPVNTQFYVNGRVAIAPSDDNIIYASWVIDSAGWGFLTNSEIFRSTDAGNTFTKTYSCTASPALCSYDGTTSSGGYGQANYCLLIDPVTPTTLYTGAHLIYKSTDGAVSFTPTIPDWWCCIHTDIHDMCLDPSNSNMIFAACDGGVFVSYDQAADWQPASNGLYCSQYFSFGQSHLDSTYVVGGLQDNGIMYLNDDNYLHTYCGGDYYDFTLCDYFNPHNTYTSYGGGLVFDPYNRANSASLNLPDEIQSVSETPCIEFSPLNAGVAYAFDTNVWITTNLNSYVMNNSGGTSSVQWSRLTDIPNETVTALAISPNNDNLIYFITGNGRFYTCNINHGAVQSLISIALPGPANIAASITISTLNPDVIYATGNKEVFRSSNGGKYFKNITNNLPRVNYQSMYIDPYNTVEGVYVITNLGVYYTDLTLPGWVNLDARFPDSLQNPTALFYKVIAGSGIYKGSNSATSHVSMGTWGAGFQQVNFYDQKCYAMPANFEITSFGAFSAGTACYDNTNGNSGGNNAYSVVTNGAEIGGTADQFSMVKGTYMNNGSLTTEIYSIEKGDTNTPGETGLMMRTDNAASDAPFVMVGLNGNGQEFMRYRTSAGGASVDTVALTGLKIPYPIQLELTRTGNTVSAYAGGTYVGIVNVVLGDTITAGVAAAAGSATLLNHTAFSDIIDSGFTQLSTGISEVMGLNAVLHPNPAHNLITLELPATGSLAYHVMDVMGRIGVSGTVAPNTTSCNIDVAGLAPGNYFIDLFSENGDTQCHLRFVKK